MQLTGEKFFKIARVVKKLCHIKDAYRQTCMIPKMNDWIFTKETRITCV